jgi:hypothetical protein
MMNFHERWSCDSDLWYIVGTYNLQALIVIPHVFFISVFTIICTYDARNLLYLNHDVSDYLTLWLFDDAPKWRGHHTIDTSMPIQVLISDLINRARVRQLNHEVSTLLMSSCPSYLDHRDPCTLVLFRNQGEDRKEKGFEQVGFRLQKNTNLWRSSHVYKPPSRHQEQHVLFRSSLALSTCL